jgi:MerR family transcriptional regulator/heat shock protein HspR
MQETKKKNNVDVDASKPVLTLGIISQLSGIPAHSVRQYIEKGLIIPFKQDSKRHLFCMNDVSRLKHIHSLIHDQGLNFAGIRSLLAMVPCWGIRECSDEDRQNCDSYSSNTTPCWEASEKGRICRNEECRECEVYTCLSHTMDIKSVIRDSK